MDNSSEFESVGSTSGPETSTENMASALAAAMVEALKKVKNEGESKITPHAKVPKYYSPGQNFRSWLSQLNQYIELVQIPYHEKKSFLVTLLDQQAYRAVELLRLTNKLSFEEFTAKLEERFDNTKTRGDYKLLLRARKQKSTEDLDCFADELLELADNAYPDASLDFRTELARDQFLDGVAVVDDIRENRSYLCINQKH